MLPFFIPPVKKNISERSLFPIVSADVLLASRQCKTIIKDIRQTVDISDEYFDILYQSLINSFVEFVQLLPANNEAPLGGLMNRGLLRASFALQQQKNEDEDNQPDPLLVYTLFSCALLFDVGFVTNDRTVMISEKDGTFIKEWLPNKGKMQQSDGDYYRVRYGGGMSSGLSRHVTPLFAQQLMPLAGFNWIAQEPDALNSWITILNNEQELTNDLNLHLNYANKKIIDEPTEDFFSAINIKVPEPEETALGEDFLEWLKNGIDTETISINTYDSDIHEIENGLFLETPEIINKFCAQSQKNPTVEAVFTQLKKIGFINLDETNGELATYTYNYEAINELKPTPVMRWLDAQKQEMDSKQQTNKQIINNQPAPNLALNQIPPEQHKKHLIRSGVKVFMPCFIFFLLAKRLHLSMRENLTLVKRAKEKLKKKLRILKRLKLRHQRFKELVKEIEEAALLKMNLNKETLDVASKEFKKWLKKLQTPFYDQ
ncbi:hypothetical protein GAMM_30095 [Gammaproteobacteria bacterium]